MNSFVKFSIGSLAFVFLAATASSALAAAGALPGGDAPEPAPAPAPAADASADGSAAPAAPRFYTGIGLDLTQLNSGRKATITGANVRAGYFVMPSLAIEGMVYDHLTKPSLDRVAGTEAVLKPSYALFLKPHHSFGSFDTFLSLGYADTKIDIVGKGKHQVGDKGFAYGLGTRIPTSSGAFDFEYLRLLDKHGTSLQGLMFSYAYLWGKSS